MAAISCKKRARMFDDGDAPMPMEPTCSPARMLVLESPSSKRSRMGQHAMDDEREGVGSPFQGGCDQADAAGACSAPHPLPSLPPTLPPSPLVGRVRTFAWRDSRVERAPEAAPRVGAGDVPRPTRARPRACPPLPTPSPHPPPPPANSVRTLLLTRPRHHPSRRLRGSERCDDAAHAAEIGAPVRRDDVQPRAGQGHRAAHC